MDICVAEEVQQQIHKAKKLGEAKEKQKIEVLIEIKPGKTIQWP